MTKMRYGKRGQTVSSIYVYDESLSRDMGKQAARMAAMIENMPLYKRELMIHKAGKSQSKRKIPQEERQQSEQRMIEAICKVVDILEMHMVDMMQHRLVGHRLVNQGAIHNVIVALRTKCGVKFTTDSEFSRRVMMDREHMTIESDEAARFMERKAQEQSERGRRMRAVADRLIARKPK